MPRSAASSRGSSRKGSDAPSVVSSSSSGSLEDDSFAPDVGVHLDPSPAKLAYQPGELVVDAIHGVENAAGERVTLVVTNLRLLWLGGGNGPLSNGAGCIGYRAIRREGLRTSVGHPYDGVTEARLVVPTAPPPDGGESATFAFSRRGDGHRLDQVLAVYKGYDRSRIYRELCSGNAPSGEAVVDTAGKLTLLAGEEVLEKIPSAVSAFRKGARSRTEPIGSMILTNVRVVWRSATDPSHNISLPFVDMRSLAIVPVKPGAGSRGGRAMAKTRRSSSLPGSLRAFAPPGESWAAGAILNSDHILKIETEGADAVGLSFASDDDLFAFEGQLREVHRRCVSAPVYGVELRMQTAATGRRPSSTRLTGLGWFDSAVARLVPQAAR